MSAREWSESLGITLRQCERILASMKQKGLIERIGAKSGYYNTAILCLPKMNLT